MTETNTVEQKTFDVHNTKEVLAFIFALGKIVKEAKENDGKITVMDAALLMKLIPYIGPAFDEIDVVIPEVKDLSPAEVDELIAYLTKQTGELVGKEKLLEQITAGLECVKAIAKFVKTLT